LANQADRGGNASEGHIPQQHVAALGGAMDCKPARLLGSPESGLQGQPGFDRGRKKRTSG
jgi:hypothetical protein